MRVGMEWDLQLPVHSLDASNGRAKRAFDVVVATLLLIFLSPALLVCALAILIDSPGPTLYRQTRIGIGGKHFSMLKFRSMQVASDVGVHREYAVEFVRGTASRHASVGGSLFKLANDHRVTSVGRFLRRTSLDELPQLWNVLRGDMSLVGPRPPLPYEVEHYEARHLQRLSVRPGITGPWQVGGRCRTTFEEMVAIDCAYIRRQSLALDLQILLRTIPVLLLCKGGR